MTTIEKILYRILLGYYYIYINDEQYKVVYPTIRIKYEAELLYEKMLEDNKFDKMYLNADEIKNYLHTNNIWLKNDDEKLKDCEKFLEDSKVNLYLNYSNEKMTTTNKKNISKAQKDLETLLSKKHSFDYLTIHEHATSVKNEFILMNSIYDQHNNLVFDYHKDHILAYNDFQSFVREILETSIKQHELRRVAKSDLWKSYAVASKIEKDIIDMNDDYRHLIGLHKMYDNVRQHPECPSNEIIEDDDALDGWFIYQNRKAEKEKKKNSIMNKIGNKSKDAGEVFLITDDIKERDAIYALNDATARQNIKEIINTGKKLESTKENMKWQDIPFVQRDLRNQAQEKFKNHQKGK